MIALDELKIPKGLRPVADEIVGITDSVCLSVLDEEYADLARRAVAKLARKRPSPLLAGRRATWAAGVVYALGHVNFLSDPASQPCVTADQLSTAFGVAKSTMTSKARQVRDLLRISHFSLEFQRADVAAQNPLAWIIDVNGLAVDARHVPPGIQAEAYRRGLISYVPALGPDETAARARSQVTGTPPAADAPAPSEALDLLVIAVNSSASWSSSPVPGASRGSLTRRSGQDPAVRPLMNPSSSTSSTTSSCSVLFPVSGPSWRPSSRRILSSRKPIAKCCSAGATWWRESSRSASAMASRSSLSISSTS